LSDAIVPIPGPTRLETLQSVIRAHDIRLTEEDRVRLEAAFPSARAFRLIGRIASGASEDTPLRETGEIVMIMGLPGAGKSTLAHQFVEQGYARLNRDEAGGSLRDLLPDLEAAQVNAAWRMLSKYGRLLEPDEMRKAAKRDVNSFAPGAQFRQQRELEPPDSSEGFSRIETMPFERTHEPSMTNKALIVWFDDIDVFVGRVPALRRYHTEGWTLLGLAWRPQVADKTMTHEQAEAEFARMRELLAVPIDILYCPHGGGPPVCWCRKPLPGLGVVLIQRYHLDPAQCVYVGVGPQDPGFARRLGFQYRDAVDFFTSSKHRQVD